MEIANPSTLLVVFYAAQAWGATVAAHSACSGLHCAQIDRTIKLATVLEVAPQATDLERDVRLHTHRRMLERSDGPVKKLEDIQLDDVGGGKKVVKRPVSRDFDRTLICGQFEQEHCLECHYTLADATDELDSRGEPLKSLLTNEFNLRRKKYEETQQPHKDFIAKKVKEMRSEYIQTIVPSYAVADAKVADCYICKALHCCMSSSRGLDDTTDRTQLQGAGFDQTTVEICHQPYSKVSNTKTERLPAMDPNVHATIKSESPEDLGGVLYKQSSDSPVCHEAVDPLEFGEPDQRKRARLKAVCELAKFTALKRNENNGKYDQRLTEKCAFDDFHGLCFNWVAPEKGEPLMSDSLRKTYKKVPANKKRIVMALKEEEDKGSQPADPPKKMEIKKRVDVNAFPLRELGQLGKPKDGSPADPERESKTDIISGRVQTEQHFLTQWRKDHGQLDVDGFDFAQGDCVGGNYDNMAGSVRECAQKCRSDVKCVAFRFNGDPTAGVCAMKDAGCDIPDPSFNMYYYRKLKLDDATYSTMDANSGSKTGASGHESINLLSPKTLRFKMLSDSKPGDLSIMVENTKGMTVGKEITIDVKQGNKEEKAIIGRIGKEHEVILLQPLVQGHKGGNFVEQLCKSPPNGDEDDEEDTPTVESGAKSCGGCQHGLCVQGNCYCEQGWSGPHCMTNNPTIDIDDTQDSCGGCNAPRGVCMGTPPSCFCTNGWTGVNCDISPEEAVDVAKAQALKAIADQAADEIADESSAGVGEGQDRVDGKFGRPLGSYGEPIEPGYVDGIVAAQGAGDPPRKKKWDGLQLSNMIALMGGFRGIRGPTWARHRPYESSVFKAPVPELHSKYGKRATFLKLSHEDDDDKDKKGDDGAEGDKSS